MMRGNRGRGGAPPARGRGSFNRAPGPAPSLFAGAGSFGSGYGGFGGSAREDDTFSGNQSNFRRPAGNQNQGGFQSSFQNQDRGMGNANEGAYRGPSATGNTLWTSDSPRFNIIEERLEQIENRLIAIENSFPAMKREFGDFGSQLSELKMKTSNLSQAVQAAPTPAAIAQLVGRSLGGPGPGPAGPGPLPMGPGPVGPRNRLPPGFIPPPVLKGQFEDEVEVAGLVADVVDNINAYTGTLMFDFEGQTYKAIYELKNFKNKDEIREFGAPGGKFVIAAIGLKTQFGLEFDVVGMVPLQTFNPSRIEIAKPAFRRELSDVMGNLKIQNSNEAEVTLFLRGLPSKHIVKKDKFVVNGSVPEDLTGITNDRCHVEVGRKRVKGDIEYFVKRAWLISLNRKRLLEGATAEDQNEAKKLCLDTEGWEPVGTYSTKFTPINSSLGVVRINIGTGAPQDFAFTRSVATYQGSAVTDFMLMMEKNVSVTIEGRKNDEGKMKYRVTSAMFGLNTAGKMRFANVKAFFRSVTDKKGRAQCNIQGKSLSLDVTEGVLMENGAVVTDYHKFNGRKDLNCEVVKKSEGVYELKRAWFGRANTYKGGQKVTRLPITEETKKQGVNKTRRENRINQSCIKTGTGTFVSSGPKSGIIRFNDQELAVRPPLVWMDKKFLKTFENVAETEMTFHYAEIPTEPVEYSVLMAWSGEEPKREDYIAIYNIKVPKFGQMAQFKKVTEKEGVFDVTEVGELMVKSENFYLSGEVVADLRPLDSEKFSYHIACDEMGEIQKEVPLAWVGRKPARTEGRDRALGEIQSYPHKGAAVCKVLTGKFRNINVIVNARLGEPNPSILKSTNLYDIIDLEVVLNKTHAEHFMGSNWDKVASASKKEVPEVADSEPEEEEEEMEADTQVDAEDITDATVAPPTGKNATVKAISDTSVELQLDGEETDLSVDQGKVELYGIRMHDVKLDGIFKIGDKFVVDSSGEDEVARYAYDDASEGKVKLLAKLHEFCAERKIDGDVRETLRNIIPRVNPTNHVTEIRGYYAYRAPERGKQIVTVGYYFDKAGTASRYGTNGHPEADTKMEE